MAVTHADLEPTRNVGTSKTSMVLMSFSILLGLLCFVLCLIAEATRSQMVREVNDGECRYSGNGKTPLICAAAAFLSLAVAMVMQHTHLLLALAKSDQDPAITWDNQHLNTLTWQAAFFFITTWICFSIGEVMLLIGLSVESGHLKGWLTPRPSCFIAREGLFSSAGVLGITTVFLASGLSITALRAQWFLQDQQNYTPPPTSSSSSSSSLSLGGQTDHQLHPYHHHPELIDYLRAFDKII
ncbi:hypothetical protein R6Q59_021602 [Mikania micrantha]